VDERTFVIVGASLTGAKAAETLRGEGFTGRIVLIGDETERPTSDHRCRRDTCSARMRATSLRPRRRVYVEHDVDLLLGVRATNLDRTTRTLTLDGFEALRYDKLLLATGSRVRRLDVPGIDLTGVRYLRTLPESDVLLDRIRAGGNVVVIGAGWIGLETAAAAIEHGATVTVIESDQLPLRRVLGDEPATVFADLHRAHGVTFRFGSAISEMRGTGGQLTSVLLTDGTEIPADLAVIGIGITPATELAVTAGLTVDNGIVTDAGLRTSDPDIYAAGDVAAFMNPMLSKRIRSSTGPTR